MGSLDVLCLLPAAAREGSRAPSGLYEGELFAHASSSAIAVVDVGGWLISFARLAICAACPWL